MAAAPSALTPSKRLRRRKRTEKVLAVLATLSAVLAVSVLVLVVWAVLRRGAAAFSWDFFTKSQAVFGQSGGGIAPAIVGTIVLIFWATLMAVPLGVLVAIYVSEFSSPRSARIIRITLDVLNGVPAIVIGIFVFGLLVVGNGQSGYYGSIALAIMMIPMISRATTEVLALVPRSLREASLGLGVPRWRTVVSIVLPAAIGGIITGTILAIARIAGETAPLLFTSSIAANSVNTDASQPLNSLPLTIYTYSESPSPQDHEQAWAAALLLMLFVLILSVTARSLFAWRQRRTGATGG
ncbi:MAG: phosphate ABC transporter permease PstA [Gaiellaceae bacterium]